MHPAPEHFMACVANGVFPLCFLTGYCWPGGELLGLLQAFEAGLFKGPFYGSAKGRARLARAPGGAVAVGVLPGRVRGKAAPRWPPSPSAAWREAGGRLAQTPAVGGSLRVPKRHVAAAALAGSSCQRSLSLPCSVPVWPAGRPLGASRWAAPGSVTVGRPLGASRWAAERRLFSA